MAYPVSCNDCGAQVGEPCVPGCPNLDSVFYDEINEEGDITINGATMIAGVDF